MLRHGAWMAIIIASLSVLTACPNKEIVGSQATLEPKKDIAGSQAALEPKNGIEGRWEALEPKSGLVNILEFKPDGTSTSSLLARVYMHYHIEGDKLILIPDNSSEKSQPAKSDPGEPVVYTFVFEKDSLKMTHDASGQIMDMWRDSQSTASDSIVGLWSYKHPSGGTAHMIFEANGTNRIRAPLPGGLESNYEVKGDIITVTSLDKKHTQSANYKLEDGKLVLNDGKKTSYYIRMSEPK